jgi:Transglycosylase SLT domain
MSGSFSQSDLDAIAAAQAQYPSLSQNGINLLDIAQKETGGTPNPDAAVSSTGAVGLFQILPSTATDPGFGVQPVDPSTLGDPNVSANFAGSYLSGLLQSGDTPAQAVQQYSGGNYSLSDLAPTQVGRYLSNLPTLAQLSNPDDSAAVGAGTQSITELGAGTWDWIVELLERGGIVIMGTLLLLAGLVFLFIDSKHVSLPLSALKGTTDIAA